MKQRWYIHRVSFRIIFPAVAGLILYLAMLMVFGNLENLLDTFFIQEALFLVLMAYINHEWAVFMLGSNRGREALLSGAFIPRLFYFLLLLLFTCLFSSGMILAYFLLIIDYSHFLTELVTINLLMILFQVMVHLHYISLYNIRRSHELSMEQEDMRARQLELELDSFKTEMNPDLLMECLESLLILMHKDIQESDRYIQALSNQYRYLLDNRQKEFVDLDKELAAAHGLVYLLNRGIDARLILEHEPDGAQAALVPGTLHSIICHVENSMILNSLVPLVVRLSVDGDGNILVRHANQPKIVPGTSVPMNKLDRSYRHYTGRGIDRREDGSCLEWVIPRIPDIIMDEVNT